MFGSSDGHLLMEHAQRLGFDVESARERLKLDANWQAADERAAAPRVRAAERQEKLYELYESAKTDDERAAVAKKIRDLSDKTDQANRFTVVPGGSWDATAGVMRKVPARVLNNQTGHFLDAGVEQGQTPQAQQPGAVATPRNKAEYDALPKGARYVKYGIHLHQGITDGE